MINRDAARTLNSTVTLTGGTTLTEDAGVTTSNGAPTFFEYVPTGGSTISSVSFTTTSGLTRFDDLGFVIAPAPEPSQFLGFGIGILGVGLLALRARKRNVLTT